MNEGKLIHLSTGTASNRGAASKHPSIPFAANPVLYVGKGVGWASGRRFDPHVVDEQGKDVTMETLSRMPLGLA